MDYGNELDKEFQVQWFSFTGSKHKNKKPWHWNNCTISFEKISKDIIRFIIRRKKNIDLPKNTKLRWDEKQNSEMYPFQSYTLHYLIHFDIQIISLPKKISDEGIEVQLNNVPEYGQTQESLVINLDDHHKIWQWKNIENETNNVMIRILDAINKMSSNQYISSTKIMQKMEDIDITNILPVVYHPTRDLREGRNYIQEIHLHKLKTDNKIMITIVYNDEQLRANKRLDWVYRIFRKIRHGQSFDVETFNIILEENEKPMQFDFPNIYSGHNNTLERDNIHCNRCNVEIRYYFNENKLLPILFINTSNHAMAEIDNNCNKWKIEYRLWEEQCPVYIGTNTRCEIEGYLAKHGLENLFLRCRDSRYLSCIDERQLLTNTVNKQKKV